MRLGLFLTSVLVLRIGRRFNLRILHMSTSCMQVKKLTDLAIIPARGSAFAAGFDLSSAYDLVVPKHGKAIVKTDIAIAVPENTYARIAPRSGLAVKNFIDVGAGVVDYDYRGNVGVVLFNHGDQDFAVARGDRVAQLVLERISMAGAQEVQELSDTSRGAGGFGSTGVAAHEVAGEPASASAPSCASMSDVELVQVKKLTELAIVPTRGSEFAAGFDLSSAYDLVIPKHGKAIVKTDLAVAIPVNTYARVAPRSGLAVKNFIDVGAGVVDYDYRGNVGVVLFNHGDQDFAVTRGDRVAQLVLERISMAGAQEVQELSDTSRGAGGFGSTGVSGDAVVDNACPASPDSAKRARVEAPAAATVVVSGQVNEVLFVKKLTDLATIPVRGSQFAAGFDLSSAYDIVVPKGGKAIVKTDIAVAVPEGTYARIAPRSGLAVKNFIDVGAGVVDYDYRGNVGVVLFNHGDQDFAVTRGDRVAQLVLERISMAGAQEVQELSDTSRGAGGFGSTGVSSGAVTA